MAVSQNDVMLQSAAEQFVANNKGAKRGKTAVENAKKHQRSMPSQNGNWKKGDVIEFPSAEAFDECFTENPVGEKSKTWFVQVTVKRDGRTFSKAFYANYLTLEAATYDSDDEDSFVTECETTGEYARHKGKPAEDAMALPVTDFNDYDILHLMAGKSVEVVEEFTHYISAIPKGAKPKGEWWTIADFKVLPKKFFEWKYKE